MDRPGKFQRLANHDQIEAACVASIQDETVRVEATRGVDHWGNVFPQVITMMTMAKENFARAVFSDHTIVAESDGAKVMAVAFRTGAPVSKSVRRMLRQALGQRRRQTTSTPATSPEDRPVLSLVPPPKAFG